jgi:hypothetical protein
MIVRRITAGAAGLALVGTAFAAAPAMAKNNTTTLKLDANTVGIVTAVGITPSAVKPAKLKGTKIAFPAKLKGKRITHKGGLKLALGDKYMTVQNININAKNGKANADIDNSATNSVLAIKNVLTFKGGKNTIKKNGKWKNANVALAKSVNVPGLGKTSAQSVLSLIFGIDQATVEQALPGAIPLGKATVKVKVKK